MKNKKGFTLVEVLAVVVILSILVLTVIGSIGSYISHGKNEYNSSLEKQLLASGKTYFSDNTKLLPTENYIRENFKTYNYVTASELASQDLISKDFVDSDNRECNSRSFVYAGEKREDGDYDWHACLICTNGTETKNYSQDDPICQGADWKERITPRCEIENDKIIGSGNPVIDRSVNKITFTQIDEDITDPMVIEIEGIEDFDSASHYLKTTDLTSILANKIKNEGKPLQYGTWKVELSNNQETGDCGGIELVPKYSCDVKWGEDGKVSSATYTNPDNDTLYLYYQEISEDTSVVADDGSEDIDDEEETDNVDGEEDADFGEATDEDAVDETNYDGEAPVTMPSIQLTSPANFKSQLTNLLATLVPQTSGETKEYMLFIGTSDGKYIENCDKATVAKEEDTTSDPTPTPVDPTPTPVDTTPPECSLSITYTSNMDNTGRYKFKTVMEASDDETPPEELKRACYYDTMTFDEFKTSYATKSPTGGGISTTGNWTGGEATYNSSKIYKAVVMDQAGNKGFCYHKIAPPVSAKPRCYFAADSKKDEWLKGGAKRTLTAYCYQPKNHYINKASKYIVGNNKSGYHYYKKISRSVSKLGNWTGKQTSERWRKIKVEYVAKKYSEKHISHGKERVRISYGYLYGLSSSKKKINNSNTAYSSRIKVDNTPPSLKATVHNNKHSGAYHASKKHPFKVTFKCTDKGAGMGKHTGKAYLSINGKKYVASKDRVTTLSYTIKKTSASKGKKYKVVCVDGLGYKKTKTYKYNIKNYSCSKSKCGQKCVSSYSYYTYHLGNPRWRGNVAGSGMNYHCSSFKCSENTYPRSCERNGYDYSCLREHHSGCNKYECKHCWHY